MPALAGGPCLRAALFRARHGVAVFLLLLLMRPLLGTLIAVFLLALLRPLLGFLLGTWFRPLLGALFRPLLLHLRHLLCALLRFLLWPLSGACSGFLVRPAGVIGITAVATWTVLWFCLGIAGAWHGFIDTVT